MAEEIGVRATIDTSDLDKGLSQYESALKGMDGATDTATGSIDHMNAALDDTGGTVKGVKFGIKELESAINVAERAFRAIKNVVDTTVGAYIGLAAQVRDLTRATGVSSEAASRMIETMGDLKIPTESLTMAMRTMIQNGLNPTVETLADLSDQYLAIKDPVERAAFAMEKFGARGGLEMTKALELGGDELRRMNDSVGENKILSEQAVKAAREYEIAQENLADAVEGLQIQIGQVLAPIIVNIITDINNLGKSEEQLAEEARAATKDLRDQSGSVEEYTKKLEELYPILKDVDKFQGMLGDALRETKTKFYDAVGASGTLKFSMVKLSDKIDDQQAAWTRARDANRNFVKGLDATGQPLVKTAAALDQATVAADRLTRTTSAYNELSAGKWTAEQNNYKTKLQELKDTYQEVKDKAEALSLQPNRTEAQNKELKGYVDQLGEIETEIGDVEKAHKRATDQIIIGWIQATLAADGVLDQKDIDILLGLQVQWGLITIEEQKAYQAAVDFALKQRELADHPTVIKIVYDYSTTGNPNPPYSPQGPYVPQAEGGAGWVTEPTMFLLGEKGEPEYYEHTPLSHMGDAQMQDIAATPAGAAAGGGVTLEFSGDIAINNGMDWAQFTNGVQLVLRQEISR
jgi:chromosome segregation ATPase